MFNKQNKKTVMKEQDSKKAITNFDEVSLGYTKEEVMNEAARCLNCKNHPCIDGCPLHNNIPETNCLVALGEFEEAYKVNSLTQNMPGICGRVCNQAKQCEGKCIRGLNKVNDPVAIGAIERFVSDYHDMNNSIEMGIAGKFDKKIAIIGSGPSGLSCACDLIRSGYIVDVFEGQEVLGGILTYGIPEFVLPKTVVEKHINKIRNLGVNFYLSKKLGKDFSLEDLTKKYDAVYLANGADKQRKMNIDGENATNVFNAYDYLMKANLKKNNDAILNAKNVVVVGGGNVAIDCDRVALRLGGINVTNVYRRTEIEMPARKEEYERAKNEGVNFEFLVNPIKINVDGNNKATSIICIRTKLGEVDASGRRSPVVIPNSEFEVPCDIVVMALGSSSFDADYTSNKVLINKWGYYDVNKDTLETSINGVYAGGDAVNGPATVVEAIRDGKKVAKEIMAKFK